VENDGQEMWKTFINGKRVGLYAQQRASIAARRGAFKLLSLWPV
jgi:hypothetical protein